jgi:hypothetical protein
MVAHGLVDHVFFLVDLAFAFMLMAASIQAVDAMASGLETESKLAVERGVVGSAKV